MYNYCTLFDSNYFSFGLSMYESLKRYSKHFHLYIFAFDEKCYKLLTDLKLEKTTIVSLNEFENEKLLSVKQNRTKGEYCWTCTTSIIKYCLENYNLTNCTYLDADLYFFSNPNILIDEMGDNSVLITPHRYTKKYDQSAMIGIYCVQFMTFKNDDNGIKVLNWWVNKCIDWCYARAEDGKFGDQKYLDNWTQKFQGVYVCNNLGAGVAPWNVQQYNLEIEDEKIIGIEKLTNKKFDLIFYHFHALKFVDNNTVNLGSYDINHTIFQTTYRKYILNLAKFNAEFSIKTNNDKIKKGASYIFTKIRQDKLLLFKYLIRKFSYNKNTYSIDKLKYGTYN